MKENQVNEIRQLYKSCGITEGLGGDVNNTLNSGIINNKLNLGNLQKRVTASPQWTDSAKSGSSSIWNQAVDTFCGKKFPIQKVR